MKMACLRCEHYIPAKKLEDLPMRFRVWCFKYPFIPMTDVCKHYEPRQKGGGKSDKEGTD